jgi:hypothetical protein
MAARSSFIPRYIIFVCSCIQCLPKASHDSEHVGNRVENLYIKSFAHLVESLDRTTCEHKIYSPNADLVWTASYLRIDWNICEEEDAGESLFSVRLDEQSVWRGMAGFGHSTIHGISDGTHSVSIDELDPHGILKKTISGVRFVASRGMSLLGSMAKKVEQNASECAARDEYDGENEDDTDQIDNTDDVTFVTAALDIGRRHGNISFEDDYIGNLRHLLSLQVPLVIHLQSKNVPLIEPYLHSRAVIRIKVPRRANI